MVESREDRAERLIRELREVTQEAAGLLKDLTRLVGSAREQVREYASDQVAQQLDNLATQAVSVLKEQNEQFIDRWAQSRAEACEMAKAHMAEDWRLAIAVNSVGHNVYHALREVDTWADAERDLPGVIPTQVSPAFMKTHPDTLGGLLANGLATGDVHGE